MCFLLTFSNSHGHSVMIIYAYKIVLYANEITLSVHFTNTVIILLSNSFGCNNCNMIFFILLDY